MKRIYALILILILSLSSLPVFAQDIDETYFSWPTKSQRITDTFGTYRSHGYHKGIDIGSLNKDEYDNPIAGDKIVAAQSGKVVYSGYAYDKNGNPYANLIAINHDMRGLDFPTDYIQTVYTHGSNLQVSVGDTVHRGQYICDMDGTIGYDVHLHYETRIIDSYDEAYKWSGAQPVNPLMFYRGYIIMQ